MRKDTAILKAQDPALDRDAIAIAAELLRSGGLVVFPTETVYGIGANALDPTAVEAIFAAKGRPQDNPLIVHVSTWEETKDLVRSIPPAARALADRFWPGPLTIILPRTGRVPDAVSAGLDTVAIRMPSHPVARALIRFSGVPVAAPSANRSGSPSPTEASHCIADLDGRVDAILDGGPTQYGLESTVVTLAGQRPRLLRPGAVTPEQLKKVLGDLEIDPAVYQALPEGTAPSSPGMKYRHYAPTAQIHLVHGSFDAFRRLVEKRSKGQAAVHALVFDGEQQFLSLPCVTYGEETKPETQAEQLFSALRELDRLGARTVYARCPTPTGIGLAVYNRLVRASGFSELYPDAEL